MVETIVVFITEFERHGGEGYGVDGSKVCDMDAEPSSGLMEPRS